MKSIRSAAMVITVCTIMLVATLVSPGMAARVQASDVVPVDDNYSTPFETTLDVAAPGVLINDVFPITFDDFSPVWMAQKVSDPLHGTVTLNPDGSFTYIPNAGFSGQDSFTYELRETAGAGHTHQEARSEPQTATVTITVGMESVAVPGCDTLVYIPETAVGGMLVRPEVLEYEPGLNTDAELSAGKTLLVLAQDATGEHYQVLWQCQKLWLPLDAVGPNPQYPWNGAPLP